MIRSLIPPVATAVLLAGCVTTADYRYYQGRGDYYYGQPIIEYREHHYGYPWDFYGYYGYPRAGWHLGFRYGYPYYGWHPYYGYFYYGYPYPHVHRRPVKPTEPSVDPTPDRPRSPWRDLEHLRRRSEMRDDVSRAMTGDTEAPWRTVVGPHGRAPVDVEEPRRPRETMSGVRPRLSEAGAPPPRVAPRWREASAPDMQPALPRVRERDDDHTP